MASDVEAAMSNVLRGTVTFSIDGTLLTLAPTTVQGDSPTALTFRAEQP